ncbi:uncharacterized protein LOC120844615 [Ixodes scapularis]|uniref:uncharacterized protein LOC120844615 n=1 Tax=Ixodes scapularis TaxID=6945 RepID=UPI001A9F97CB|nr:uncharacterized protein LOC120844615 [Ixodes scapularis]
MSLAVPPPFLSSSGRPVIPWKQWRRVFPNYLLVSGGGAHGPARRKARFLHCFGVEAHRVFTLPATHPPVPLKVPTAGAKTPTTPEEYNVALAALETNFAAASNAVVERYRFRQGAQLPGEPVEVLLTELRYLSTDGEFALLMAEFIRDQLVAKTTRQQLRERLFLEGSGLT